MVSGGIGEKLRSRREQSGLTQGQLAQMAEISRPYLSLIERGEATNVSFNILSRLALALGTNPSALTGEVEQDVVLSSSLRKFALEDRIPFEEVLTLSRLALRGKAPETVEEWRRFYSAIGEALELEE